MTNWKERIDGGFYSVDGRFVIVPKGEERWDLTDNVTKKTHSCTSSNAAKFEAEISWARLLDRLEQPQPSEELLMEMLENAQRSLKRGDREVAFLHLCAVKHHSGQYPVLREQAEHIARQYNLTIE